MSKEFIICSAIKYDDGKVHAGQPTNVTSGFIVCGRRHKDCYNIIPQITGLYDIIQKIPEPDRDQQGFLTSEDRFVYRKEAMVIAKAANQLLLPALHEGMEGRELSSEDIFPIMEHEEK